MNPLYRLREFGQSVYVDEIRRSWFEDGTLRDLIERDGLRGVTSNPAIFQKAIAESTEYDDQVAHLARGGMDAGAIYEEVVVDDIAHAADLFRPEWDASDGRYGWVSLEVDPHLAHDTDGTIAEARHLSARVDRPNVFIKVPATAAGVPAIERLLTEGIPVNITLLFGLERYRQVREAHLNALEARVAAGRTADVASVASFFLSRIDVAIDPLLDDVASRGGGETAAKTARLKGQIAVANAKLAYRDYEATIAGERWRGLVAAGARPQRLLWASTSTKNPDYPATMYVEPLVGRDTVNTMPTATLDAYREHGEPRETIRENLDQAEIMMRDLHEVGIDIDAITARLEDEGIDKFTDPFDRLSTALEEARVRALG